MSLPDSFAAWIQHYEEMAVRGIRSKEVAQKIDLHLHRFRDFFEAAYGHERISACVKRDVLNWQTALQKEELAAATINNHIASLSGFLTWVHEQAPRLFAVGNPTRGISDLALPPLEPRTLTEDQVRSLKNLCDRLERFHLLKGKAWSNQHPPLRANSRPKRDRAIVYVLLSTGLRREELIQLDLSQLEPHTPEQLRQVRRARIHEVQGKGKTERNVFLSSDARLALADYLEFERAQDVTTHVAALFLCAAGIPARAKDGRLSVRSINLIMEQIGRWHDAEQPDTSRHISPLRPHDLRHTFAFQLSKVTGADAYELERRLGHRSPRYIQRYTNPPEQVAATYIEDF